MYDQGVTIRLKVPLTYRVFAYVCTWRGSTRTLSARMWLAAICPIDYVTQNTTHVTQRNYGKPSQS